MPGSRAFAGAVADDTSPIGRPNPVDQPRSIPTSYPPEQPVDFSARNPYIPDHMWSEEFRSLIYQQAYSYLLSPHIPPIPMNPGYPAYNLLPFIHYDHQGSSSVMYHPVQAEQEEPEEVEEEDTEDEQDKVEVGQRETEVGQQVAAIVQEAVEIVREELVVVQERSEVVRNEQAVHDISSENDSSDSQQSSQRSSHRSSQMRPQQSSKSNQSQAASAPQEPTMNGSSRQHPRSGGYSDTEPSSMNGANVPPAPAHGNRAEVNRDSAMANELEEQAFRLIHCTRQAVRRLRETGAEESARQSQQNSTTDLRRDSSGGLSQSAAAAANFSSLGLQSPAPSYRSQGNYAPGVASAVVADMREVLRVREEGMSEQVKLIVSREMLPVQQSIQRLSSGLAEIRRTVSTLQSDVQGLSARITVRDQACENARASHILPQPMESINCQQSGVHFYGAVPQPQYPGWYEQQPHSSQQQQAAHGVPTSQQQHVQYVQQLSHAFHQQQQQQQQQQQSLHTVPTCQQPHAQFVQQQPQPHHTVSTSQQLHIQYAEQQQQLPRGVQYVQRQVSPQEAAEMQFVPWYSPPQRQVAGPSDGTSMLSAAARAMQELQCENVPHTDYDIPISHGHSNGLADERSVSSPAQRSPPGRYTPSPRVLQLERTEVELRRELQDALASRSQHQLRIDHLQQALASVSHARHTTPVRHRTATVTRAAMESPRSDDGAAIGGIGPVTDL